MFLILFLYMQLAAVTIYVETAHGVALRAAVPGGQTSAVETAGALIQYKDVVLPV